MYRYDDEASARGEGSDFDVESAFGEHGIAYWVPQGHRLVPASPQQIEVFEGDLRVRRETWHIRRWQAGADHAQRGSPGEQRAGLGLLRRGGAHGHVVRMMLWWTLRHITVFDARLEHGLPGGGQSSLRAERERTAREI